MKRVIAALLCVGIAIPLQAQQTAPGGPSREQRRKGAEEMIRVGEQAVARGGRAERVEKRRTLVEDWKRRLSAGEDPCAVYADIFRASTTF